eukprot:3297835-Pyramimonas_sp.AAC.1
MLVVGKLIPKKSVGDRAIGLVSMLGRLWSMAREPVVRSWSKQSAQHWDAAVAGNSFLMEAYLRAIDEELAHEMMM